VVDVDTVAVEPPARIALANQSDPEEGQAWRGEWSTH
jgi:hypothetical protein